MSATTTTETIPTDADAITADWLTGVLRSSGTIDETVAVTDFETEPVGVGIGLVGCLVRLTPTYAGDDTLVAQAPEQMIAKFPAPEEGSRFVALVLGMYRKEVGFYRNLAEQCQLPHARCYHAAHDAESDDFIILMEDLSDGRVVDQIGGCDREDAEAAIDALADFHAGYWNDEALAETDWLGALCDAPFPDAITMSYDQSWAPVQELFGDYLTPEVKDFGDRFTELLPDLVTRLSEGPFTLSHGDYRLDNIFFGAGDPDADRSSLKVCDWQLVDRSRGARDLAYFTSQSLIPELRAEIERSLVERYVTRLATRGVDDYPFDVAWHDYRLATAFAFVYPVVAGGSLDHADERATNLTGEMFRRSVRAIVELDALELV